MEVDTKMWCKHALSYYPKCDVLMNNIFEAFNSTILVARKKPILTIAEWIKTYLMNRMSTNRVKLENWPYMIMHMPRKRLNREIEKTGGWVAIWGVVDEFEVHMVGGSQAFIVNLAKQTCSCNFWEFVGIPCRHIITTISKTSKDPKDYVSDWYSRDMYEKCYTHNVNVINGKDMWPEVECEEMLSPAYKKGPRRLKKLRRRKHDEASSSQGKNSRS